MCQRLVLAIVLIFCFAPLYAGNNPQAQQQLVSAAERSNLLGSDVSPWQLELDFEARLSVPTDRGPAFVPTSGHLTLKWAGKNKWWRLAKMGTFEQTDIRNGEMLYTTRNAAITPLRLEEVFDLLQGLPLKGLQVKKQKTRTEKGVNLACFLADYDQKLNRFQPRREVCLNANQEMVSIESQADDSDRRREEFTDLVDFQGHRFPKRLELLINGSRVVTATVTSLSPTLIEETNFLPSKNAIERRQCEDMKPAIVLQSPDPIPSDDVMRQQLNNDLTVVMTVLTDGTVSDVLAVGASHTQALTESMIQALKKWKFTPAMCGSDPVVSDIHVVVHTKF